MYKIVALLAFVAVASAQQYNRDPHTAAILNEQRYLNGDGKFGAAYTQEDGVEFKEESDADGTRRGSYSYVDPSGQRRTVTYTAGKNGFQATGDHLPQAPAHTVPTPGYQPQPQYNSPVQPQYQPQYNSRTNTVDDDGQYRPDQYDQPQYNQTQPQYQPQPQYQQPQPQYQPQQHQFLQQPQQYQQQQPQQQYQPQPQQYQPQPQQQYTTAAPHRFYPPGKLSLNRSPDGFSYSFQKS